MNKKTWPIILVAGFLVLLLAGAIVLLFILGPFGQTFIKPNAIEVPQISSWTDVGEYYLVSFPFTMIYGGPVECPGLDKTAIANFEFSSLRNPDIYPGSIIPKDAQLETFFPADDVVIEEKNIVVVTGGNIGAGSGITTNDYDIIKKEASCRAFKTDESQNQGIHCKVDFRIKSNQENVGLCITKINSGIVNAKIYKEGFEPSVTVYHLSNNQCYQLIVKESMASNYYLSLFSCQADIQVISENGTTSINTSSSSSETENTSTTTSSSSQTSTSSTQGKQPQSSKEGDKKLSLLMWVVIIGSIITLILIIVAVAFAMQNKRRK